MISIVEYNPDWLRLLRSHPIVAQDYAQLKRKFAIESDGDREKYTQEKTTFISDVLKLSNETVKEDRR